MSLQAKVRGQELRQVLRVGLTESCLLCKAGFFLLDPDYKTAQCTLLSENIARCYYSNSSSFCTDCNIGYYFINDRYKTSPDTKVCANG